MTSFYTVALDVLHYGGDSGRLNTPWAIGITSATVSAGSSSGRWSASCRRETRTLSARLSVPERELQSTPALALRAFKKLASPLASRPQEFQVLQPVPIALIDPPDTPSEAW